MACFGRERPCMYTDINYGDLFVESAARFPSPRQQCYATGKPKQLLPASVLRAAKMTACLKGSKFDFKFRVLRFIEKL